MSERKVTVRVDLVAGGDLSQKLEENKRKAEQLHQVMRQGGRGLSAGTAAVIRQAATRSLGSVQAPARTGLALSAYKDVVRGAREASSNETTDLQKGNVRADYSIRRLGTPQGMAEMQEKIDLTHRLSETEAQEARIKASMEGKNIGSPQHIKALKEQISLRKQLAGNAARSKWADSVAERGTVGASITAAVDGLVSVKGRLREVDRFARYAFASVAAGIAGFAAAAGPDVIGTLTGSVQLLAGEIGGAFIPNIIGASAGLQNAARWSEHLDASTKESIGTFGKWSLIVLGGGWALAAIGRNAITLITIFQGLKWAAMTALGASYFVPVVGAIVAITAVVAGLTNGFGLLNRNAAAAAESMQRSDNNQRTLEHFAGGGRLNRQIYDQLPLAIRTRIESQQPGTQYGPVRPGEARPQARPQDVMRVRGQATDEIIRETQAMLAEVQRNPPEMIRTRVEAARTPLQGDAAFQNEHRRQAVFGAMFPNLPQADTRALSSGEFDQTAQRRRVLSQMTPLQRERVEEVRRQDLSGGGLLGGALSPEAIRQIVAIASGTSSARELQARLLTLQGVRETGVPGVLPAQNQNRVAVADNFQTSLSSIGDFYEKILLQTQRGELEQQRFEQQIRLSEELREEARRFNATLNQVLAALPRAPL